MFLICIYLGGSGSTDFDEHARSRRDARRGQPNYAEPPTDSDPTDSDDSEVTYDDVADE